MNTLDTPAIEQSTYLVDVNFSDQEGNPVTPLSIQWTLCRDDASVVNGRLSVAVAPASTVTIALSGADLALEAGAESQSRALVVEATADTPYGDHLPFKNEVWFQITRLASL